MTKSRQATALLKQGLKQCSSCKEIKALSEFSRRKAATDGLRSSCKECDKITHAEYRDNPQNKEYEDSYKLTYREENRERELNYTRGWRERNIDKLSEYGRKWHLNNKEKHNATARIRMNKWAKDNPERHRNHARHYRARSHKALGSHTVEQWTKMLSFFCGFCPCCGKEEKLTLDHIRPLSKGGTNYIDNAQPLCKVCNSTKGNNAIVDYRPLLVRAWAYSQATLGVC